MGLMDEANIRYVFVGVETPNEESLRETSKLQNLRGKERSIVEKVHAIQAHGLEVWSGMIVGFDHDGLDIFDRQIRFVEQARVIHTSVGMLTAIPKTPLYARLAGENRLDPADRTPYGTNVIPLGMGRDALREGYLRVLHALYDPKAYFARVDSLFLEGGLNSSAARDAHLRSRPFSRFIQSANRRRGGRSSSPLSARLFQRGAATSRPVCAASLCVEGCHALSLSYAHRDHGCRWTFAEYVLMALSGHPIIAVGV
jgi:radical SAM superfamily enzyme YgiQ (UPF0313 family)